jgi:hypothetical protein
MLSDSTKTTLGTMLKNAKKVTINSTVTAHNMKKDIIDVLIHVQYALKKFH